MNDTEKIIEAILFASAEPLEIQTLADRLDLNYVDVNQMLLNLQKYYKENNRGIVLRFVEEKVQLTTNGIYGEQLKEFFTEEKKRSFSQSIIETLAIIAYKQPITRAQIEQIRGVRCEYSLNQLISQGFVKELGREQTIGRPINFGTTQKFLEFFNLTSILELPRRSEFLNEEEIENLGV